MSDSEEIMDLPEDGDEGGDDLFGDATIPDEISERDLSEHESDRDVDETRAMDYNEDDLEPATFREKTVMTVPMYRHRIPRSDNGTLQSLRVPNFFKINPTEYKKDEWQPSKWDLKNASQETPIPSVMCRRDPKTGQLQSNANIYRWSDGSVTLGIGEEHYEIQTKSLAPAPGKPYQEVQDAHYYAAAAHLTTNSLLIVGHFTEQYTVRPNAEVQDHALQRLKEKLAQGKPQRGEDMIYITKEDPELQKKQAEMAEKERIRAQRRRENAAARMDGVGGSRYRAGGALSIGDLEGGRRAGGGGRKRGAAGGKKRNRGPEYDSDDDLPSGKRREDDYDLDDGFLVDSDEEESEDAADDDEEDILDDDDEDEPAPRTKRRKAAADDEDADGEADLDDVDAAGQSEMSSRRKRRVVDDDDEDGE
ncbi:hypothetical protein GQ53DRAFT_366901 [Thozetella sp. PMI_491]|nr:hypothetical protein GQ53DRAFT_366901 [Thozetella sp. PMI_491]